MADRPIIFSAPMVQALLAGRKTQTRRIAKITAVMGNKVAVDHPDERLIELDPGEFRRGVCHYESTGALSGPYRLPAAVGDRLWVKEDWRIGAWDQRKNAVSIDYPADGHARAEWLTIEDGDRLREIIEESRAEADEAGVGDIWEYRWSLGNSPCRVRRGRFMFRAFSRLTLHVTDVRVQRVQEISTADAMAEGIPQTAAEAHALGLFDQTKVEGYEWDNRTTVENFRDLWNSLHGADAWAANPWVAAISFDVEHANIDSAGAD